MRHTRKKDSIDWSSTSTWNWIRTGCVLLILLLGALPKQACAENKEEMMRRAVSIVPCDEYEVTSGNPATAATLVMAVGNAPINDLDLICAAKHIATPGDRGAHRAFVTLHGVEDDQSVRTLLTIFCNALSGMLNQAIICDPKRLANGASQVTVTNEQGHELMGRGIFVAERYYGGGTNVAVMRKKSQDKNRDAHNLQRMTVATSTQNFTM